MVKQTLVLYDLFTYKCIVLYLLTDINECDSAPCQNGATCNNNQPPGTYSCDCVPGYNGTNCKISECDDLSVKKNIKVKLKPLYHKHTDIYDI